MTPIETVLASLDRDGHEPKRFGEGWTAHCPGPEHDAGRWNRSLFVGAAPDGRVILHCFGEWGAAEVLRAAGVSETLQ